MGYDLRIEPDGEHTFLSVFGLFTLCFSAFGGFWKNKCSLPETVLATILGVLIGPRVLGWVTLEDPLESSSSLRLLMEVTKVTISIQVVTTALELPHGLLWRERRSMFWLLGPVLFLSWWTTTGVLVATLQLSLTRALLVSACLTPTDPVLAHVIVKGTFAEQHIPGHLRSLISAESGANDGLAFPFVMLPLTILQYGHVGAGKVVGHYVVVSLLWEVCVGLIIGAALGWLTSMVLHMARRKQLLERDSGRAYVVVLALAALGVARVLNTNAVLACFTAGASFSFYVPLREDGEMERMELQETADVLVGNVFFLVLGVAVPWGAWNPPGSLWYWWQMCLAVVGVLLLRRLPSVLALYRQIPQIKRWKEALFVGWFGPIGVAAVFYALEIIEGCHKGEVGREVATSTWYVVTAVVFASVVVHGVTGVPGTLLLERGQGFQEKDEFVDDGVGGGGVPGQFPPAR